MTRASRRLALALFAVALVTTAACDQDGSSNGALRVDRVAAVQAGAAPVYSVTVAAGRVAWALGDANARPPYKVMLLETDDGKAKPTELVRTSYPDGYIPHVRLGAKWAVFADLSSPEPAGEGAPQAPWRVDAVDLESGERVTVTEQSPSAREKSPAPRIDGDTVVWSARVAGGNGESEIYAFDLPARTKRTLARAVIGNTAVGGGNAYYDRYTDSGSDVFSVALDGSGPPVQVSHSAKASKPAAGRFGVAWVEPPQGNSTTVVLARPGRSPEVLAASRGPDDPVGYNPQVCRGFALYDPLAGLSARAFGDRNGEATVLARAETLSAQARWACDGDTVTWVSFGDAGAVVNVARVEVAASR